MSECSTCDLHVPMTRVRREVLFPCEEATRGGLDDGGLSASKRVGSAGGANGPNSKSREEESFDSETGAGTRC